MYSTELVNAVAKETGCSGTVVKVIYDEIISEITTELKRGNRVTLTGFGTFDVRNRPSRVVKMDDESYKIPKHTAVHFKPGKLLKEAVYKTKTR